MRFNSNWGTIFQIFNFEILIYFFLILILIFLNEH